MKTVDVREYKSVNMIYSAVPQPMYVYDSTEEFEENVERPALLARTMAEYFEFLVANKIDTTYKPNDKYVDFRPYNFWIKTIDTDLALTMTRGGEISYATDESGKRIPTNGIYVKVFFLTPTPVRHVLYTSAGLRSVGMTKWDITGAVSDQFQQEKDVRHSMSTLDKYNEKLEKLKNKRKPDVNHMRVAMSLFNPKSSMFLDINKAVKTVYGSTIRVNDRAVVLQSEAFRKALMSTFKTLFPELAPIIRKNIDPEKMASMLTEIYDIAKNKEDVDKMLKVFDKVKEVGYEESTTVNMANIPMLPPTNADKYIDGEPDKKTLPEPKPVEEVTEALRDEYGYSASMVQEELPEEMPEEPESENF